MVLNLTSDRKMETMMVAEATVEMDPVIMGAMRIESSWGCDKDNIFIVPHLFFLLFFFWLIVVIIVAS